MNTIWLNIAGFAIKLSFKNTSIPPLNFFGEELKNKITEYYKNYIIESRSKKADFYVDFIDNLGAEIIVGRKNGRTYCIFYKEKGENRFISWYLINIPQFFLILQQVLYKLLLQNKGFMLHASAVGINGKTNIFVGKAGAGKSTVMKLLSNSYKALADDGVVIKRDTKDSWFHQTPLLEKEWWIVKENKKFPLGRIFFLRKTKYFKIEKITNKQYIFERIMRQVLIERKEDMEKNMDYLSDFVSKFNEFYFLYFGKDEGKLVELFENLNEKI